MNDLPKGWITLWVTLTLIVCGMIVGIVAIDSAKTVNMAKQGYEEISPPGRSVAHWQKVK